MNDFADGFNLKQKHTEIVWIVLELQLHIVLSLPSVLWLWILPYIFVSLSGFCFVIDTTGSPLPTLGRDRRGVCNSIKREQYRTMEDL